MLYRFSNAFGSAAFVNVKQTCAIFIVSDQNKKIKNPSQNPKLMVTLQVTIRLSFLMSD